MAIPMGWGRAVFNLEKVGIPLVKINIFERFKYQKNSAVIIGFSFVF